MTRLAAALIALAALLALSALYLLLPAPEKLSHLHNHNERNP